MAESLAAPSGDTAVPGSTTVQDVQLGAPVEQKPLGALELRRQRLAQVKNAELLEKAEQLLEEVAPPVIATEPAKTDSERAADASADASSATDDGWDQYTREAIAAAEGVGSSSSASPSKEVAVVDDMGFEPPDEVKQWLRQEDWQAMQAAWKQAEEEALEWAENAEIDWEGEAEAATNGSMMQGSAYSSSSTRRRPPKKRLKWNEDFHLLGQDTNYPPPLRRYFDKVPAESSIPKEAMRPEVRKLHGKRFAERRDIWSKQHPMFEPHISEATKRRLSRSGANCHDVKMEKLEDSWVDTFGRTCSEDNPGLHPFLRHYFDRRGLEACYRQRPFINKCTPVLRPRTPGRPSTREKILRFIASEPTLKKDEVDIDAKKRGIGDISWSRRCLMYGIDAKQKTTPEGSKIPWVADHHRMESEDNEILNPLLRHTFDGEGLESSFRQRGRHYGRPLPAIIGLPAIPTERREQRGGAGSSVGRRVPGGRDRPKSGGSSAGSHGSLSLQSIRTIGLPLSPSEALQKPGAMALLAAARLGALNNEPGRRPELTA